MRPNATPISNLSGSKTGTIQETEQTPFPSRVHARRYLPCRASQTLPYRQMGVGQSSQLEGRAEENPSSLGPRKLNRQGGGAERAQRAARRLLGFPRLLLGALLGLLPGLLARAVCQGLAVRHRDPFDMLGPVGLIPVVRTTLLSEELPLPARAGKDTPM